MLADLDEGDGARALLARLAKDAQRAPDDMAACILRVVEEHPATPSRQVRVEELEVRSGDDWERHARAFLEACGIGDALQVNGLVQAARLRASEFGGAVFRVTVGRDDVAAEVVEPETRGMVVLPPIQPGDAPDTVAL